MLENVGRTIGRFVAPAALAKFYLDPSIVVSPDGSRVYVIGTTAESFTDGTGGSAGIWVLDATTLAVESWWPPVADYMSIGISAGGSLLFLVGSPGLDAAGTASPNEASVTVVDTATGEVRLVAGRLGPDTLTINRVLEP
jgi:DNA-binding beta-propeller fold protein YncE